jgi:hypothetical protein
MARHSRINKFQIPAPVTTSEPPVELEELPDNPELPKDDLPEISHWVVQNKRQVLVPSMTGGLTYVTEGKIIRDKEWADKITPFGVELKAIYARAAN